jgi:PHD/YefM family antitoxin component YafN of YafNO toxin-antitoxin module
MVSISQLQADTSGIVKETEREGVRAVARNGKIVAFLVSRDRLESLLESLELQKNKKLMAAVRADRSGKAKAAPFRDEDFN